MSENIVVTILRQLKELVDDVAKLRRDIHRLEFDRSIKSVSYYLDLHKKNEDNFQRVFDREFVLGYSKAHERDKQVKYLKSELEARSLEIQNFNCEDALRMSRLNPSRARLAAINMLEKLKQELDDCQDLRRRIERLSSNLSVRSTEYYCNVLGVHKEAVLQDSEFTRNFMMALKMEDESIQLGKQLEVRVASILSFNYDAIFKGFGI